MSRTVNAFMTGFRSLFVGLSLIRREASILKLAILPFAIDFIVLCGTLVWGSQQISGWVEAGMSWAFAESGGWIYSLAYYPVYLLAWLVFLFLLFFLGYVVASVIAAPFNSLLAEQTLVYMRAVEACPFHFRRWVSVSLKMMWASLLKAGLFICVGILFFGISFIPVLGLIASVGVVLIMSFDSADYSFEVFEYSLSRRIYFFRKNFPYFLGAGAAIGLTLFIPGLNFLLFPAAVVGHAELVGKLKGMSNHGN